MTPYATNEPDFGPPAGSSSDLPAEGSAPSRHARATAAGDPPLIPTFPHVPPKMVQRPGWDRGAAAYPPPPGTYYPGLPQTAYGYAAGNATVYPATGWPPADGPIGPKAWPIAVLTMGFGVLGAVSAGRRSRDARCLGLPVARYWWVFGGSLVAGFTLWTMALGVAVAILVPSSLNGTTVMDANRLDSALLDSGTAGVAVNQAQCVEDVVGSNGSGTYRCRVTFADGIAESYRVTVNDDGTWAAHEAN
jgi:hypothetical protein